MGFAGTNCVLANFFYPPKGKFLYPFLPPFPPPKNWKEEGSKERKNREKRNEKEEEFPSKFPVAPLFLFQNKELKKEEKKEIFFSISLPFPTPKSKKRVKRRRKETKEKEKEEKKERWSIFSISYPKKKREGKKREMILFSSHFSPFRTKEIWKCGRRKYALSRSGKRKRPCLPKW